MSTTQSHEQSCGGWEAFRAAVRALEPAPQQPMPAKEPSHDDRSR
jgi:hypothetical protein